MTAEATPTTVLIADDSMVVRAVLRAQLEEQGYRVVEAADGAEAIARCRTEAPDVALLDVEMPGMDGYGALREMQADPLLSRVPVVFITGRTDTEDVVRGLRLGAHDYLRKPFDPPELLARVYVALRTRRLEDQLRERNAELDQLSRTDPLTGLSNRRHLADELRRAASAASRWGTPLSVAVIDVDHFKRLNDTRGHLAGDEVLQVIGARIVGELRAEDRAGRWGGEEFLVVLPATALDGAVAAGERIRASIAAPVPLGGGGDEVVVTVSIGCAEGTGDVDSTIRRADTAMYEAKAAGRNRVRAAPPPSVG